MITTNSPANNSRLADTSTKLRYNGDSALRGPPMGGAGRERRRRHRRGPAGEGGGATLEEGW